MLIRSISGIRGLTDSSLTADVVTKYTRAYHMLIPDGVIITGRDSRISGDLLLRNIIDELVRLGRSVIDCGIVPTPTVQFMVHNTEAVGGLIVTASHNPAEWNGLKFLRTDSTFLYPSQCNALFKAFDSDIKINDAKEPGVFWQDQNAIHKHMISCLSLSCIDLNRIQRRKFKIIVDAVNGAGGRALSTLLDSLGCEVIELNGEPTGHFNRGTEPLPENLDSLCGLMKKNNADVGFALDPDADRLAAVDENGAPLGEEYTLVLATEGYLKETGRKESIVVNLSTSLAIDKMAELYGSNVVRSTVGEINVVKKMNDIGSEIGGEGNGGVILRECHLGRDSLVAATLILNRMSQTDKTLSQIYKSLPKFYIVKDKISLEKVEFSTLISKVSSTFSNATINNLDGIKFIWEDSWIHLRKSNTEPIVRIYAEATGLEEALELVRKVKTALK